MNKLFANATVGRKNIGFAIVLFLILGVLAGIPLTIDFFGGSMLNGIQYQEWKVVHGYGVFLSFVNFFLGLSIDKLNMTRREMELSSWSFLLAGLVGGFGRAALVLVSALGEFGIYVSLGETALFVLGTFAIVRGLMTDQSRAVMDEMAKAGYSHAK